MPGPNLSTTLRATPQHRPTTGGLATGSPETTLLTCQNTSNGFHITPREKISINGLVHENCQWLSRNETKYTGFAGQTSRPMVAAYFSKERIIDARYFVHRLALLGAAVVIWEQCQCARKKESHASATRRWLILTPNSCCAGEGHTCNACRKGAAKWFNKQPPPPHPPPGTAHPARHLVITSNPRARLNVAAISVGSVFPVGTRIRRKDRTT